MKRELAGQQRVCVMVAAWLLAVAARADHVILVQEGAGRVLSYPTANSRDVRRVTVGLKPHEIELASDQHTAYVSNFGLLEANHKVGVPGATISVIDTRKPRLLSTFQLPDGLRAPHGLKLRPPRERELFTNTEVGDESMVVFDARTGAVLRHFPVPEGTHNFIFDREGNSLYLFTLKGEVCRLDPDSGSVLARTQAGSPRGLAWDAGAERLISAGKGELLFLEPERLEVVQRMPDLGVQQLFYPAVSPDARYLLAPAVFDGVVLIIDVQSGRVVRRVATGSPLLVRFMADGRRALVSNVKIPADMLPAGAPARDGGLVEIDLHSFKTRKVADITDTNGLVIARSRARR